MSDEMQSSTPAAQSGATPTESSATPPGDASRPEERILSRAERRAARREMRGNAVPWLGGAILIVLGLVFLAQNFGIANLNNWWAIFILIPAVGSFSTAWRRYQAAGQVITSGTASSLIGGLVLTAVALAFLFNLGLNASLIWPLLLILGGVAVLLQAVTK